MTRVLLILFLIVFTTIGPPHVFGRTWTVCSGCAIETVEKAVELSSDEDTILVSAGTYRTGKTIIDKAVHLIGLGQPQIISEQGEEIFTILSNGVTVSGFRLEGVEVSYLEERAAIRVKRRRNFRIQDNEINHCFFGIYLERAYDGVVKGNRIRSDFTDEASSGNAIHAWYCKNITIVNNDLAGHRDGIYFEFVDSSTIEGNTSRSNLRYGLHFMFSNDDTYVDNTFKENGAGVAVMFSRRIDMFQNRFLNNWGRSSYGLLLKEIYDARIERNYFGNNTLGIFVEGSTRITYLHNTFERNGWALKFAGGSIDNEIRSNNFVNNTLDLMLGSKFSQNRIESNYWSNYSGYDLDKDGIGDVPYYPVKLFAYILDECPESIILLRSLFIDLLNFSEKVSPVITPKNILDPSPQMMPIS